MLPEIDYSKDPQQEEPVGTDCYSGDEVYLCDRGFFGEEGFVLKENRKDFLKSIIDDSDTLTDQALLALGYIPGFAKEFFK